MSTYKAKNLWSTTSGDMIVNTAPTIDVLLHVGGHLLVFHDPFQGNITPD